MCVCVCVCVCVCICVWSLLLFLSWQNKSNRQQKREISLLSKTPEELQEELAKLNRAGMTRGSSDKDLMFGVQQIKNGCAPFESERMCMHVPT